MKKKSAFFTFICSFLPGAAEMYLGFMKNGFSIMALFFLSFIVPSVLRTSDVFILIAVLLWFFSFFHARNLAAWDQETLRTMEDKFIWEEYWTGKPLRIPDRIVRTWGAGILIVYGVVALWQSLTAFIYQLLPEWIFEWVAPLLDQIPQMVVAVLIIAIGLRLIRGKKEAIELVQKEIDETDRTAV